MKFRFHDFKDFIILVGLINNYIDAVAEAYGECDCEECGEKCHVCEAKEDLLKAVGEAE